jgi:hypothetical protein
MQQVAKLKATLLKTHMKQIEDLPAKMVDSMGSTVVNKLDIRTDAERLLKMHATWVVARQVYFTQCWRLPLKVLICNASNGGN